MQDVKGGGAGVIWEDFLEEGGLEISIENV